MTHTYGKSMSTSGSNFLQHKATANPSSPGGIPPASAQQENLESRRLFQHIGLPPMAKTLPPPDSDNVFAPPPDGKTEEVMGSSPPGETAPAPDFPVTAVTVAGADRSASPASAPAAIVRAESVTPDTPIHAAAVPGEEERRYDIPFYQKEKDILVHLSDFTNSPAFAPFQNPRSRRSSTSAEGATVVEELAQDFSVRKLTSHKENSSEQVRDRLGRLIYEKFQEGQKWTARFLCYHDQNGKKSPFVQSLKSLSSDGCFREVQYSKLGQVESEKETLYDLKMATL